MNLSTLKKQIISTFFPFNPERIILFGSIARKDWDDESDIDLIVVYDTKKHFLERLKELYMSWNIPKSVDILAYTPSEFSQMIEQSVFLQDILREGITIYERD